MGIDDIPAQIGRVVRLSVRSKTSFVLSFLTAAFVIGFAADLLYSFAYIRLYNVKDAQYSPAALISILAAAFGVPLIAGLWASWHAYRDTRPFKKGKYSVAIAPFYVFSLDPDVLGTPSKKQSLEDIVTQFFNAIRARLAEYSWYDEFVFRSLPPFVRIVNKTQAEARLASLSASLLIWGMVIQKVDEPLLLRINLCGYETNLSFTGQIDPIQMADTFGFFMLTAVGFANLRQTDPAAALKLFDAAAAFAGDLDKKTNSTNHTDMVKTWKAEAVAKLQAPAAA